MNELTELHRLIMEEFEKFYFATCLVVDKDERAKLASFLTASQIRMVERIRQWAVNEQGFDDEAYAKLNDFLSEFTADITK